MASKQREALVAVKKLFDGRIMFQPAIRACHKQVNEALAEPRLNCEVGTVEEQLERHNKYCNSQPTCKKCLREDAASTCVFCYAKWSQRPYEESEATDGGK